MKTYQERSVSCKLIMMLAAYNITHGVIHGVNETIRVAITCRVSDLSKSGMEEFLSQYLFTVSCNVVQFIELHSLPSGRCVS